MSDVFQQFSDFIDGQEHPQWPQVGRYRAGDRVCLATYIGGEQRGEVMLIRGTMSPNELVCAVDTMEREFRGRVTA